MLDSGQTPSPGLPSGAGGGSDVSSVVEAFAKLLWFCLVYSLLKELSVVGGGINCSSILKAFASLFWACSMRVCLKGCQSLLQVHHIELGPLSFAGVCSCPSMIWTLARFGGRVYTHNLGSLLFALPLMGFFPGFPAAEGAPKSSPSSLSQMNWKFLSGGLAAPLNASRRRNSLCVTLFRMSLLYNLPTFIFSSRL